MSTINKSDKGVGSRLSTSARKDNSSDNDSFLDLYLSYVSGNTEAPTLFHVWCAICGVAATLGKFYYFTRGHFRVCPNLYVMLIGSPGTGKGTAINILQNLMLESGYKTFAADKSSKEKFLVDFHQGFSFDGEEDGARDFGASSLDLDSMFAGLSNGVAKEVFVIAEEFNDFIGSNNIEFISLLTKLWSYEGTYRHRLKNSKSVSIYDPCVNILGGNTSASFALAFPPEIIGQGFLARLLPIYGEPTGRKISFPERPNTATKTEIATRLHAIRETCRGDATVTDDARELLDRINREWVPMQDSRFEHYKSRRFTQLIKLCLVTSAFRADHTINANDVRDANTILTHTEELMPKAIGEFGKARNADTTSKIMELLWQTTKPLTTQDLWKLCSADLNAFADLAQIIANLRHADKIQSVLVGGKEQAWLAKHVIKSQSSEFINPILKQRLHQ